MNSPKPQTKTPKQDQTGKPTGPSPAKFESLFWSVLLVFWSITIITNLMGTGSEERIPYSTFMTYAQEKKIDNLVIRQQEITGTINGEKKKRFVVTRVEDPQLASRLAGDKIKFQGLVEDNFWKSLLQWTMPTLIFLGVWMLFASRFASEGGGGGGMGPGLMSIEKNRAKVYKEEKVKVTFDDVAGVDEAKEELKEVVGFLKEPQRYTRLGGHMPKGIVLVGPPGTGKTLLARAVAGEAAVPFFSISGSEFVEMFVGVGAARVRDLFAQAQKSAPCIIFIDELDALGRARGINPMGGGHDEKEQTLNQLLVEMDGFDSRQGVVLLAATNRPEILDAALLRAGRFDRHVLVDRPDKIGRSQILKIHAKNVKCDPTVSLDDVASSTPGFTGADLANLVNEAVLLATRRGAEFVQDSDFTAALERVVAGLERKNRLLNKQERTVVATHEMGHALVALSLPDMDPIQKVSIIPRGVGALGYTIQRPIEDRFLMSRQEMQNKLAVLLGGRAAESIIFEEISTGAADDLSKATIIARSMVTKYGMIKSLGPVTYETERGQFLSDGQGGLNESHHLSEETLKDIDQSVRQLLNNAQTQAISILEANRRALENGARELLLKETLNQDELKAILNHTPTPQAIVVTETAPESEPKAHKEEQESLKPA